MTDGLINEDKMSQVAGGLRRTRLHGAAGVIALFNTARHPPHMCNVSVGKSAFAVTPQCLLLFHGIRTANVYFIQAKDCFVNVTTVHRRFDRLTEWGGRPQIQYTDSANVQVHSATVSVRPQAGPRCRTSSAGSAPPSRPWRSWVVTRPPPPRSCTCFWRGWKRKRGRERGGRRRGGGEV